MMKLKESVTPSRRDCHGNGDRVRDSDPLNPNLLLSITSTVHKEN